MAVGFHPILVNEYEFKKDLFINALKSTKFIGEVGLDFSVARSEKSKNKQKRIFEIICRNSVGHIMSIHSRLAERDMLELLRVHKVENAIFHWYTGSKELIPQILDEGYYFSVNPAMLKSNKGKGILKEIPLNRLIIETDGPFSKYGGAIVEPVHLRKIYIEFEKFYGISNLEDIVFENLSTLLG